jgi:branched-chain amino acid transport system substrate-binding protein
MRQWLTLGLAFGLGLAFADTASAQVKLGVAGPLTGGSAAFGAQLKNGVEQAVEDINATGGILGQKIQLSSATIAPIRKRAYRSPTSSSATA